MQGKLGVPSTKGHNHACRSVGLLADWLTRMSETHSDLVQCRPHVLPPLQAQLAALLDSALRVHGRHGQRGVGAWYLEGGVLNDGQPGPGVVAAAVAAVPGGILSKVQLVAPA